MELGNAILNTVNSLNELMERAEEQNIYVDINQSLSRDKVNSPLLVNIECADLKALECNCAKRRLNQGCPLL